MSRRLIVFDLDGTLIDSAPSILASLQAAFAQAGIEPVAPLTQGLIGPPLGQLLAELLPQDRQAELSRVVAFFKQDYDTRGCLGACAYTGVPEMLHELRRMGMRMSIATNKRLAPARKIVAHLGWQPLFDAVHTLDSFEPALANKRELLVQLRAQLGADQARPIYVGDRAEDALAAAAGEYDFFWAAWGYGGRIDAEPHATVRTPRQIALALR